MKYLLRHLIALVAGLLTSLSSADLLIVHDDSARSISVAQKVASTLTGVSSHQVRLINLSQLDSITDFGHTVISLGSEALTVVAASHKNKSHIIALFMSRDSVDGWIESAPPPSSPITFIPSTPSPVHQVALVKSIFGEGASLGVMPKNRHSSVAHEYSLAGNDFGVTLHILNADSGETFMDLPDSDAVVLLKPQNADNTGLLRRKFHQAYDLRGMAVIGYSSTLVKAGSLATVYYSIDNNLFEASRILKTMPNKEGYEIRYPTTFNVSFNKYVARSLGLIESSEEQLTLRISDLVNGAKEVRH